ncbi:MFS transporter [Kaarinaea lacus]
MKPVIQKYRHTENDGLGWLYDQITGDEDSRVCKDIPESACRHQPRNFFAYLGANLVGKIADELVSARLTLPWLLTALGAPNSFAGFLVPIREAGVLLPQLVVAAYIRMMAIRKGVWVIGAILSAVSMLCMAFVTVNFSGTLAGWTIITMLIVYSLARGLCSVSAKDVLGKTVSKTRRGALMGYSVAVSSIAVLLVGLFLQQSGGKLQSTDVFLVLLLCASVLWLVGVVLFSSILEEPGATEGGGNALSSAIKSLGLLLTDRHFRQFVVLRSLLLSVALLPPFFVILAQQHTASNISSLGWLIIANGIAGALSAVVWGKLSDRSSRSVMVITAVITAITGLSAFLLTYSESVLLSEPALYTFMFFLISIAHGGARLGRKVYLVDMATTETRSQYVAVSNTVIGLVMLVAGSIGVLADIFGVHYVILILSLIAVVAAFYAKHVPDVSG